jgi:hypothetical protein
LWTTSSNIAANLLWSAKDLRVSVQRRKKNQFAMTEATTVATTLTTSRIVVSIQAYDCQAAESGDSIAKRFRIAL